MVTDDDGRFVESAQPARRSSWCLSLPLRGPSRLVDGPMGEHRNLRCRGRRKLERVPCGPYSDRLRQWQNSSISPKMSSPMHKASNGVECSFRSAQLWREMGRGSKSAHVEA